MEEKRFIDHLRDFGGSIRALGPVIAAAVIAVLGAADADATTILGGFGPKGRLPDLAGRLPAAARDAANAILDAARGEMIHRGPGFRDSLLLCFTDHVFPIIEDVAAKSRDSAPALAAAEAHQNASPPSATKPKRGRKAA